MHASTLAQVDRLARRAGEMRFRLLQLASTLDVAGGQPLDAAAELLDQCDEQLTKFYIEHAPQPGEVAIEALEPRAGSVSVKA